jgi:hypothetical protein
MTDRAQADTSDHYSKAAEFESLRNAATHKLDI